MGWSSRYCTLAASSAPGRVRMIPLKRNVFLSGGISAQPSLHPSRMHLAEHGLEEEFGAVWDHAYWIIRHTHLGCF